MPRPARRDEKFLAVDAEFQLCPIAGCMSVCRAGASLRELCDVFSDLEGGEGVGVDLARVVEHDDVGGRTGDGEDDGTGVVGAEVGPGDVEGVRGVLGAEVPESDGIVEGGGDEFVAARGEGEGRDGCSMASKIADVAVVVRGEVSDCV